MENGTDDRKRLRRFLLSHLDAGDVAGVTWLDRGAGLFRIDWPRGGKSGFNSERDGLIFKLWAQETGRWKQGDPENTTVWSECKTRVRNALHKLKDFEEQKELGKPDDPKEPFKVYKFKLVPPSNNEAVEEADNIGLPISNEDILDFFKDLDARNDLLSTPPDTPKFGEGSCAPVQPMMLNIPIDNNAETSDQSMPSLQDLGIITPIQSGTPDPIHSACAMAQPLIASVPTEASAQPMDQSTASLLKEHLGPFSIFQACEVQVCVMYRGVQVLDGTYTVPTGFRIFYGSPVEQKAREVFAGGNDAEKLFGPVYVTPVPLPDCTAQMQSQKQLGSTLKLLSGTKRGVLFQFSDGNIWAYRLCGPAVYWLDPNSTELPMKLARETPTKVFDHFQFLKSMQKYVYGRGKKPYPYFKFCIGQSWNLEEPFEKNLVAVTVYQKTAAENLETVRKNQDSKSLSMKFSDPTEDDHLVANLEQLIANLSLQQNSAPPTLNENIW
ncbi:interferon regulatory factor 8-like [Branchiostoma lanceolatum]|uniref:interferon regulatory factor 8-like n=1 Tax=Branchiostoma lanceolatum TaxID=7740 RepID=UPI003456A74D